MFQHIKDLVELDDSGPKVWKLLRDVIQPNTLPMVIVLEKELAALSTTSGHLSGYGSKFCRRTSAGATRVVVLPTKLLRGMELQEAAEEEGEGDAKAVGEALAEGEAEVTTMRGMGALVAGGAPEWRVRAGTARRLDTLGSSSGAQGKANPGMFLMVEDVKGSEGDVGLVGKVVMHPLTHWVIDSGCTSHMTPRADLLDEVKPLGKIKFVAAASGALLPVIGVGNAKVALVKNRVLATVGDKQWVPYTKWYGSAPAVNMLRAYGCMVVFHVLKEKGGKLEAYGRWGVHLGLAKDHKGWLIWDLTSQQLTVSRDVTVSEEEISGVAEDGGEPQVEDQQQQQQQQQDAPQGATCPADRPRRDVRPPNRLTYPSFGKPKAVRIGSVAEQSDEKEIAHCYWAAVPEPKTLAEALSGPEAEKWKQSVKEEYDSLLENETWELCELPPGTKAISSKLIFRHKYGPDGELTRYKSRLVAKGFQQTEGKDFDEIFAPVGKGTTLRVMLGMAANRGWRNKQMDITTAFLNGIILEEMYMLQPEGLDDGSGRVCRLKKAIYGLKQAPRAWYHGLEETLLAGGFKKSECDHSLFLLQEKEQFLMLLCSKMGDVKYYLGMHVERDLDKGVLRLHQRKYCEGLAEKYGLQDGGKPATPLPSGFTVEPCADEEVVGESDKKLFHSMVGALNYAANHTRPDIAFAISRLASVVSRPSHEQLEAAKRLVRYVSATASVGLDFNSVKADGTSIGGYVCLFGGGAVSGRSKKQNEVGLSSCETEYMALHHGAKEVVWLRRLLEEIGVCQKEPTVIFCDNESAVKLAKNACLHGLTKHIRPKWHWVRRLLDKEVWLEIVNTHQQAANILTKRLAESEHWKGMKLAEMSVH
ncbi:unnamed protein product [Closterium sp. NIES-53]